MIDHWDIILRLSYAAFLGACVGLEREFHGRPAGLRTYLILSLGSALLMVISENLFYLVQARAPHIPMSFDPSRIAAQAITGIGFLGAGVIIRYKDSIRGLTTAACVWAVAAVGLTVGAGFYLYGTMVTALIICSLLGLKVLERRMRKDWYQEVEVVTEDRPGIISRIQEILEKHHYHVVNIGLKRDLQNQEVTANFSMVHRTVRPDRSVLEAVFDIEGVKRLGIG
jgi:putative Mg2+ transporter-C (MgtC) family protein